MSAYAPSGPFVLAAGVALLAATLVLGLGVTRIRRPVPARLAAWLLVAAAFAAAERLTSAEAAGLRMLGVLGALLYALKGVVGVEERASGAPGLSAGRWLAFAALWPGMRPSLFARLGGRPLPGAGRLLARGLAALVLGAALFVLARRAWAGGSNLGATLLALPALSLMLHFGLFNLLAGTWRLAGARTDALFRAPLRSSSLREFWGRRWNLAFSEMTALGIYRPVAPRVGRSGAIVAAFLASGLLHEIAISLPVMAGFGLPMSYFALHGALMLAERGLARSGRRLDRRAWLGRIWTLFWLAAPLPLLFHRPFLAGVVWPLLGEPR